LKITDITTTALKFPDFFIFQDATVFPPKPGAKGRIFLFVRIKTDEGIEGFAPANPGAHVAVRGVIEELKSSLIGEDPMNIERIWFRMFWLVRGYGRKGVAFCAISAIDTALWDLKAKVLDLPLYKLLGPYTDAVPVYGSGGWTNLSEKELVKEQLGWVERGFKSIKLKVGKNFGNAEKEDIRRLAAVRKAVGDDITIYIDANNGYYAKQAIALAPRFEEYNAGFFEEPVLADDIEGLAAVARATKMPVATGEHEYTKYGFKELLARGAADILQPDVSRVGGVSEWIKVAHMAHGFNLPVANHSQHLISLHLACATPNLLAVEYLGIIEEADKFFYTEIPMPKDGMLSPFPDKPGLDLELKPEVIKKYQV